MPIRAGLSLLARRESSVETRTVSACTRVFTQRTSQLASAAIASYLRISPGLNTTDADATYAVRRTATGRSQGSHEKATLAAAVMSTSGFFIKSYNNFTLSM